MPYTPPPGLALGEPDDRLQRGFQYHQAFVLSSELTAYWIIRFRG